MKKRSIILLFCAAALIFALTSASFADFGDNAGDADFGWDGGGDYGGGGGGWDWDWDDDDDYHYDHHYGNDDDDDYSSGGDDTVGLLPTLIVVGLLVALIVWGVRDPKKKSRGGTRNRSRNRTPRVDVGDRSTPQGQLRTLTEYRTLDPDFDAADLREKASNLYVRMQNCWTAGDISELRPYFTDALFTQYERQLAAKRAQKLTNYVERISVQNVAVRGFRQSNGVDHMILKVEARIVDYTLNDETGALVSGSRDREKLMVYEWDLSRTSGMITLKRNGVNKIICPNCGAPLDINVSARCEYCDSVITSSEHDWAICSIKALSQTTM